MMFSMNAVALMAAMLLASRTALGQDPPTEKCTDDNANTHYCKDCKTGMKCGDTDSNPVVYANCTKPGQACAVVAETSTCVPLADSPCSCDKPQQCDAYDDGALFVCLNGGSTTIVSPCVDPEPTCINDVCTDGTEPEGPCEVGVDGFVPVRPECTSGAYCMGGSSLGPVNCSPGQFFDPAINDCATFPPANCSNKCTGPCPDKMNCSRYYVCDSSGKGIQQDCPTKQYFDPKEKVCQTEDILCPTHGCVFDETSSNTTTTTTAAGGETSSTTTATTTTTDGGVPPKPTDCNESNVNQRYPNEENCKMYVLCALVAPGQYQYLNMTCPGNYVYNPTTTYCDYPENVPGCVVPTTIALRDSDTNEEP